MQSPLLRFWRCVVAVIREIIWARVNDMRPNSWNPNRESPEKFNLLTESIEDLGFSENIQVRPIAEGEIREEEGQKRWYSKAGPSLEIIGGEHRWNACKVAGYGDSDWIPTVFFDDLDETKLKAVTVRMNVLSGEIDPEKFTQLWDELAGSGYYSEQALRDMMGIAGKKEFEKLYKEVRAALPPELQKELDKTRSEIKSIEDLSVILNRLFAKYGSDLSHSFMVFEFGGRQHTWVRMRKETNRVLDEVKQFCRERNVDMNDVLMAGFRHVLETDGEWPESAEDDQSIEEWD